MRKTSQDGGDSTSITSGVENETKKPGAGIIKTKRNSIKRKVTNFSNETDDTVIEPLLPKDKEKTENPNQCAKYNILLSKTKTDANSDKGSDKDKLITDKKSQKSSTARNDIEPTLPSPKDNVATKSPNSLPPIHNHMNTNVFSSHDGLKGFIVPKSHILVEIDGTKPVGYNPSPLIFTTAKIHTDGKTNHMEPVQITSVPILSTTEVSVLKSGGIKNNNDITGVNTNVTTMFVNSSKIDANASLNKEHRALLNKSTDMKIPNSSGKTSVRNTTLSKESILPVVTKDTKKSLPIFTSNNPKSITSDQKDIQTQSKLIVDNKNNKDEFQTRIPQSQVTNSAILNDKKLSNPAGLTQTVTTANIQVAFKDTSKQMIKDDNITSITHEVITKKDKSDVMKNQAPIVNLNKNDKHTVLDSVRSDGFVNTKLVTDAKNALDSITKEKVLKNTNSFLNNKQLQRQKNAIASDTDDSIAKVKNNVNLPSLSNDTKSAGTNIISTANITTEAHSPVTEVSSLREKSKSLSTSNSQPATNSYNPVPIVLTTSSICKLSAAATSTINKNSTAPLQACITTVSSEPVKSKSLPTNKSSINTVPNSGSVTKPENSKTKPQVATVIKTSNLSPTTVSIKTTKTSSAEAQIGHIAPQTTTSTVSVANSVANKTKSQTAMKKPAESNVTTKPSIVKINPTSMNSITTQATSINITSTLTSTAAPVTSTQKSTAAINKNGGKSKDRDTKDSKSLKA